MYRQTPQAIGDIINELLRHEGLETPLLQRRATEAWDSVVGEVVSAHTTKKFIKNQTLFVEIDSPALRTEVMMSRGNYATRINQVVGSFVVANIRVY